MTDALRFDEYTGRPAADSADADAAPGAATVERSLSIAIELGLEPPRFCGRCGRRTVVQVVPDGWSSVCSRHGRVDSFEMGRR